MGFLKKVGLGLGQMARDAGKKAARVGHHATNSEWVRDVLTGAGSATQRNAQQLGEVADGALDLAAGAVTQDGERRQRGVQQVSTTAKQAVGQVARGAATTAGHAARAVHGAVTGDKEKATTAIKEVGKVVAIGTLSIGIADGIVEAVDVVEEGSFAKPLNPSGDEVRDPLLDSGELLADDDLLDD